MKEIILDYTKKTSYENDVLLTDIMKAISWEDEVAYNETHERSLSSTVFREYALFQGISMEQSHQWSFNNIWTFTLNPESEEWKKHDAALIFISFTPSASGGRRKFRKTREKTRGKRRSKRSTRRR